MSKPRGGGRGRGGRGPEDRDTQVSKKLSSFLRHNAEKEGFKLDERGFINVAELLKWNVLRSMKVEFAEIQHIVTTNAKQRFELISIDAALASTDATATTTEARSDSPPPDPAITAASLASAPTDPPSSVTALSTDASHYLIRASQGHSLPIASESLLTLLDPAADTTPPFVVHGTNDAAWKSILKFGGLSRMGRGHVHFAEAVPGNGNQVISGMRASASILVWVDVKRSAEEGGLKWWRSNNGVVLTEGDEKGVVKMEWVERVERRGKGTGEAQSIWKRGEETG